MQIPLDSLREVERERGIAFETLLEAIEKALASAYLRMVGADETRGARAVIEREDGNVTVYAQEVEIDPDTEEIEIIKEWEDTPADFGRIAAQTAKQVILQRLREAERDITFGEYSGREGDIVTGIVQQQDNRYTILDLGKAEALMPPQEQIPHERYEHGARLKAYIVEVRKSARGPQIIVSRTHPNLIRRLFELEVPEILDGVVEIKGVAREPGHRSKIAVASNDRNVDPVGACVGSKGARVRMVMNELRGEKIDIIKWTDSIEDFVANALSPAKVTEVRIQDDGQTALVIVPDYQLSLAIGKEGQNARLSARLTGLRVDIKSETQIREEERREASAAAEKESAEGEAGEDSTAEKAGEVAGTSEVVEAEKGEATAGD
ncbi:MAG: transcription termination/antitermination protein NusA [Actinobacteria bacterium]|jgi:transcription termination/antitermination protein NusA|nr:transcription termination/antitermination protein NusA [Actinomycetota bacterium]